MLTIVRPTGKDAALTELNRMSATIMAIRNIMSMAQYGSTQIAFDKMEHFVNDLQDQMLEIRSIVQDIQPDSG